LTGKKQILYTKKMNDFCAEAAATLDHSGYTRFIPRGSATPVMDLEREGKR
jgi:hypothetical protein